MAFNFDWFWEAWMFIRVKFEYMLQRYLNVLVRCRSITQVHVAADTINLDSSGIKCRIYGADMESCSGVLLVIRCRLAHQRWSMPLYLHTRNHVLTKESLSRANPEFVFCEVVVVRYHLRTSNNLPTSSRYDICQARAHATDNESKRLRRCLNNLNWQSPTPNYFN